MNCGQSRVLSDSETDLVNEHYNPGPVKIILHPNPSINHQNVEKTSFPYFGVKLSCVCLREPLKKKKKSGVKNAF